MALLPPVVTEDKPTVTVGRFQVTPSKVIPALLSPATPSSPAIPSPPSSFGEIETESSTEGPGESESSVSTCHSIPLPHQTPEQDSEGQPLWEVARDQQEEEEVSEEEEEGEEKPGRRSRRQERDLSLMGTSADSGLSVTAQEHDGRLWEGGPESPQYSTPLHHLWMSYTRNSNYLSSDDTESEDEDMWEELQELRARYTFLHPSPNCLIQKPGT